MVGVLTGVFSGVLCALIAAAFGYAYSRGKRFDFWILVVGALFGLFAVQLGMTFFAWEEWVYMIGALALFEYGGKAVYVRSVPLIKRRVDKSNVLLWAFIVGSVVFVEWWLIAFFMWFYPMVGSTFAFYELNAKGELVWRWFDVVMPQIEMDAIAVYLIFGLPAFCYLVASLFAVGISNLLNRRKCVQ
jgi:hypothetical protein